MSNHEAFLAYAPRGPGLMCAVFYFKAENETDVYGWWTGFKDYRYLPAYFQLENFYAVENTAFFATEGSDLYGGWRYEYSKSEARLDKPIAVEDEAAHRLDQLQDAFFSEWLFYRSDAGAQEELAAYAKDELSVQDVNIRHKRLNKLDHNGAIWTFRSHGLDGQVIDYLRTRWPLEYRSD
jgi:hypothetical protein